MQANTDLERLYAAMQVGRRVQDASFKMWPLLEFSPKWALHVETDTILHFIDFLADFEPCSLRE